MKTKMAGAPRGGGKSRGTEGRWMEVGQQERRAEEMGGYEEKRQPPLGCVATSLPQ